MSSWQWQTLWAQVQLYGLFTLPAAVCAHIWALRLVCTAKWCTSPGADLRTWSPLTCTFSFLSRQLDAVRLDPEACWRSLRSWVLQLELSTAGVLEDRAPICVWVGNWAPTLRVGGRLSHCTYLNHARFLMAPYKMVFKSHLWSELANAIYTAPALDCLSKIPSGGHSLLNFFKETEPVFAS